MNEREFCKPGSLVERHKPNPRVCRGEKGKGRLFSHTPSRFLPLSKASRPAYAAGLRSGSAVSVRLRRTRDCGLIEFSTPEETATSLSSGAVDPSSSRPLSPPMPFDGPLCAGRLEKGGGPVRGTVGRRFLDLERADEALRRLTGGRAFRSGPPETRKNARTEARVCSSGSCCASCPPCFMEPSPAPLRFSTPFLCASMKPTDPSEAVLAHRIDARENMGQNVKAGEA